MNATYSVDLDLQVLTCARCGRQLPVEPVDLRRGQDPRRPDAWAASCWRTPEGWRQFRWPSGDDSAACPDCWPEIERRAGMFLEELRNGVPQWLDPMTRCGRRGCDHVRAAHGAGFCSSTAVGCACKGFVEPRSAEA